MRNGINVVKSTQESSYYTVLIALVINLCPNLTARPGDADDIPVDTYL
jgi:hypothetical protein